MCVIGSSELAVVRKVGRGRKQQRERPLARDTLDRLLKSSVGK